MSRSSQETVEVKLEPEEHQPIPSPDDISLTREVLFVFLICLCQILTQSGVAQTINTTTEIGKTFGIENEPGKLSWFSASYSLTVGTFILIAGRLGDMYGYKTIYIGGLVLSGVWSLIAGFAGFTSSDVFFNVARAFQGMGPAFSMPNAVALMGHYFPNGQKKMIYLALFGAVAPLGFVFGALFGGIFTELVWWPWMFWVGGIVYFGAVVLLYLFIPRHIGSREDGGFDWLGSITGVLGLVLINFAWNQGASEGWETVYVYVLLIVGFLFMGGFVCASARAQNPLVPLEHLQGECGFVLGCIAAGWSCFGITLYYTFRWEVLLYDTLAIMRGVQFIPTPIVGFVAAASSVYLLKKTSLLVVMLLAMLAFLVGVILMGTRPVGQTYWAQKFVFLCVQGFGMDMSFPAGTMILSSTFPKRKQGLAGSLVSTFVNYSISIGLGLAGTVEYYIIKGLPDTTETKIKGIRSAFYVGIGLAALGVVLAFTFLVLQNFSSGYRPKDIESEKGNDPNEAITDEEMGH